MNTKQLNKIFARAMYGMVILALALSATGSASALPECTDPLGCVTIGPSDPVHIAYALVTEGPGSSLGIDERNGIEIAIDDSGEKILGHDIQFDGENEACSAEGGAAAGATLAADPTIVAVVGTSCSVAAREAMPLLSEAGFVMVSPSNTGIDLTEPGNPNNHPGYLRVSWNDKVQGVVAARFAWEYLGISTAATIIDGSPYSVYLEQAFADEFTNLGGTITTQEIIDPSQTDFSTELTNIATGAPEMLYFPVFMPQGGYILNQARTTSGLENTYLMGSDAMWTEEIVNAAAENVEGLLVTSIDLTKKSPAYTDHFLPAYQAKFGTEPISVFHAHAYDAFMMIKAAIEQVAVLDSDGTVQIGRQALRDALYGTVDFAGLTGNLTCNETGDCAGPHIAVFRYHTGQFPPEYLWPPPPIWRDDFDGPLAEPWHWVNENADKWGFNDGFLRIYASPYGSGGENLLLRPVAEGDFMIKTRVLFEPNTNFQFAGLVIWQDEQNFLQLGRAFCDIEGACVGNGIYFDYIGGGTWVNGNFATSIGNPSDVFLRLERRGDMVRAFYSADNGISWYEIGTHWIPPDFQVNGVGLTVPGDYNTPDWDIPADFDFFELTEGWGFLPEGFHDYDSGDVPSWACNAGGWAADPDDRAADVNVEIVVDHQTVANLTAGDFRQDLLDAGVCVDGNCSFSTSLWGVISSYEPHRVDVWAQDDTGEWVLLSNSAKTLTCRTYDIYAYDPLTGTTKLVTTNLRDSDEYDPTWSPNGKKIAHDVVSGDSHQIYITDVKTGVSAILHGTEDGGNDAAWSPNGKWIAFDRRWFGEPNIYIVPATGGDRGVPVRENAVSANWAPNGKRIVFQDDTDGSIRTAPVDGGKGGETLVAEFGGLPAWSPDGNWIAYSKDGDIWKVQVNVQGKVLGEPIQLTSNPFNDGKPTWSPDSQTIIYDSGFGQDYDMWKIPAVGGTPTWLTGAPVFGDYGPANARNSSTIAYASISPEGQAARLWISAYTYDVGTWNEGDHFYHFEGEWNGGSDMGPNVPFNVSEYAPQYDGFVLMRAFALRGGVDCSTISTIRPDQQTRFHVGYVSPEGTYQEAVAYFSSLIVKAFWDDVAQVELQPHEIIPFREDDWPAYFCSYTK